jgi:hypothetical protein
MRARRSDLPIPESPAKLIERAERLDRLWAALERSGYRKPSLAAELARWERDHEGAAQ